jgi:hypothetical protein
MTESPPDKPGKPCDWSVPDTPEKWPGLNQHAVDVGVAVKGLRMVLEASRREAIKLCKNSTAEEILEAWLVTLLPLHCMAASLEGRAEALLQTIEGLAGTD